MANNEQGMPPVLVEETQSAVGSHSNDAGNQGGTRHASGKGGGGSWLNAHARKPRVQDASRQQQGHAGFTHLLLPGAGGGPFER